MFDGCVLPRWSVTDTQSPVCLGFLFCLHTGYLACHSLGIRVNARVMFLEAQTASGGQAKLNGCLVFLVLVSCSGQRRSSAGVWGFRRIDGGELEAS